jgi:SecDF, P1 head subdomain
MSQDLEARLAAAFHTGALPAAPTSLVDRLEEITTGAAPHGTRSGRRTIAGLLVAAALLLAAGAVALSVGSAPDQGLVTPTPGPSPTGSLPGQSALRIEVQASGLEASDSARITSILQERIAATGVVGGVVEPVGEDQFRIILPAVTEDDVRIVETITGTGMIDIVATGDQPVPVGHRLDLSSQPPIVGGTDIQSIDFGSDPVSGGRTLEIVLSPAAATTMAAYTTDAVGTFMAITLDGKVIVAPMINGAILEGDIQVTLSTDTESQAETEAIDAFVAVVNSGVLPGPLEVTGVRVVPYEVDSSPSD